MDDVKKQKTKKKTKENKKNMRTFNNTQTQAPAD